MNDEEQKRLLAIKAERDAMAIYLKINRSCGCCLNRQSMGQEEPCISCLPARSKWQWGFWKGKAGVSDCSFHPTDAEALNLTK